MTLLPRRGWWLLATAALFAGGTLGVACSNNPGNGDGGGPDSGGDTTTGGDSGKDGQGSEGGGDSGPIVTNCEAGVSGSCNIVAQDCTGGKQCALVQLQDGGFDLECVSGGGSIPEGYACVENSTAKCVSGLECINGRCSKHCCFGDDQACGTSHPEGFTGKCNLGIQLPNKVTAYTVCTYNKSCAPFQITPCGAGLTCLVEDSNGTADCYAYTNGGDAGLGEHAACNSANECNDGMGCYGALDGGASNCQYNCYNKNQGGPYDNTISADAGAGYGGCPSGETCKLINWSGGSLPTWFGICAK